MMDATQKAANEALDLIAFRVLEVMNYQGHCPAWQDMYLALSDILSVVKETKPEPEPEPPKPYGCSWAEPTDEPDSVADADILCPEPIGEAS